MKEKHLLGDSIPIIESRTYRGSNSIILEEVPRK